MICVIGQSRLVTISYQDKMTGTKMPRMRVPTAATRGPLLTDGAAVCVL